MTTFGRPESFRIAYQAALHDLAAMAAERDAALRELDAARFASAIIDNDLIAAKVRCEQLHTAVNFEAVQRDMRHKAWLEEKARADAAEAEVKWLRAIFDSQVTTFPSSFIDEGMLVLCHVCGSMGEKGDTIETLRHKNECIVGEARQQKEASHD